MIIIDMNTNEKIDLLLNQEYKQPDILSIIIEKIYFILKYSHLRYKKL